MKKNANVFTPNYFYSITGSLIVLWFICLIFWFYHHDWGHLNTLQLAISLAVLVLLVRILFTFIDIWIIRIEKNKVFFRRPWSTKWKEENCDAIEDIKLKVYYRYSTVSTKRLTVYTKNKKRYIFRSYSNKLEENAYSALLRQTSLYGKYKSLIDKEKTKLKIYEKSNRFDWIIIILLLLGLLVLNFHWS